MKNMRERAKRGERLRNTIIFSGLKLLVTPAYIIQSMQFPYGTYGMAL